MMLSQPIADSTAAATTIINENSTWGERLGLGFQTLLQGMLTIFTILFIIYIFILILGKAMTAAKKDKKSSKKSGKNEVVATEKATEPTANTVSPVSANNDEELVAVIAAAISAYTKEPTTKFRVVSFKHIK